MAYLNPLSTKPTKWSNTLKQFVGNSRQVFLRVFDHSVGLLLSVMFRCSLPAPFIGTLRILPSMELFGKNS